MVTKLPSSSEPRPEGGAVGCDTSDLIQVHRLFRWLYRQLPGLIREVGDGDVARSGIVAGYVTMGVYALRLHHETEDLVLWDRLVDRAPGCAVHVAQMKEQHAEVAAELDEVQPLIAPWRTDADGATRDSLAGTVERVRDTLVLHLGREEEQIVPVAGEVLTQAEWDEMGEHARTGLQSVKKEMPKDMEALELGFMLATLPEDERSAWMRKNLPAPVRLLYSLLLKRKYERAMDELFAGGPVPPMT